MDTWHKGRVALVGDSAACPSILIGLGSIFAIVEAYVLAGELHKAKGDHNIAFDKWQHRLKDIIARKQKVGLTNLSVAASDEIVKNIYLLLRLKYHQLLLSLNSLVLEYLRIQLKFLSINKIETI